MDESFNKLIEVTSTLIDRINILIVLAIFIFIFGGIQIFIWTFFNLCLKKKVRSRFFKFIFLKEDELLKSVIVDKKRRMKSFLKSKKHDKKVGK